MPDTRLYTGLSALLFCLSAATAAPPKVNGNEERIGPYPILRVWGAPQEMGFAHGYLLAEQILKVVGPVLDTDDPETIARYDGMLRQLLRYIKIDQRTRSELEAMLQGIEAKLGDRAILDPFDRRITLDDLILHNAGDLLRAFGCSGFTVWGPKAGDWEVITTRNFDYPVPGKMGVNAQMILVRKPDQGRHAVASITWPGYIGAFTGVNDAGVCAFMHDGTGGRSSEVSQPVTPIAITLTSILEQSDAVTGHQRAAKAIESVGSFPFSYMIRVVSPVSDGDPPSPEWVFRVDPSGVSRNPTGKLMCITTNHYLQENLSPVDGANDWSLTRYTRLGKRLESTLDPSSAWAAQGSVASSDQGFPTAQTLIVYPTKRRLDIALATWNGKVIPATESKPTTITFDELFR